MKIFHPYAFFWQLKRSLLSTHFNPAFFLISQLLWPLIMVGTYYLSYSPLFDPASPGADNFTSGLDMYSYLIPGVIVVYIYLEYVSIGFGLSVSRDYGVLEPIFLSPVNRMLWLFGTATAGIPSGILAAAGFVLSSMLVFSISMPHPVVFFAGTVLVVFCSVPWGGLVCAIFLCGRNSRFLYAVFETPAEFLSGARFPVAALPVLLSTAAAAYPLSHSVALLRLCWKPAVDLSLIFQDFLRLLLLGVVYSAIASMLFSYAERKGKRDGSLTFS